MGCQTQTQEPDCDSELPQEAQQAKPRRALERISIFGAYTAPNPRQGALTIEICRDLTLVCAPCVAMLQLIGRVDKGNKGA